MPDYKENAVVNREGWTRIKDGGTTLYRSPGGEVISNHQYYKLSKTYPPGTPIPESVLGVAAGINTATESLKPTPTTKPSFMQGSTAPKQEYFPKPPPMPEHPDPGAQNLGRQQAQQQNRDPESHRDDVIEMVPGIKEAPKGKRYDHRAKHPRASATALGQGIRKLLLLITTLVIAQILLHDDRAAMSDQEASILGMALGNLLEPTGFNESYGWLLAETGDYQAIGYVLIMYGSRINDIVQEKRKANTQQQSPGMPPPQSPNGAVRNTTPGAFMPMNPNLKSPPGINLGYGG